MVRVSGPGKLLKCTWRGTWRLDGVDKEECLRRRREIQETETREQREEKLRRNGDIIRDYRRL